MRNPNWQLLSLARLFIPQWYSSCSAFSTTPHTTSPPWTTAAAAPAPPLVLQEAIELGILVQPLPDVYILGTVHAGNQSAIEVKCLLETVKPSTVVVEVSPSRLALLRRRQQRRQNPSNAPPSTRDTTSSSLSLGKSLTAGPALLTQAWEQGGWPAAFFGICMVWPAMVTSAWQSLVLVPLHKQHTKIPRVDEFATTIQVVDTLLENATVVAADVELDTVWQQVGTALAQPVDCFALVLRLLGEAVGLYAKDPISRLSGESCEAWYSRRRQPTTAQASKQHGLERAPALAAVLVDQRDKALTEALCTVKHKTPVVCVVGLVHLEGVVQGLLSRSNNNSELQ